MSNVFPSPCTCLLLLFLFQKGGSVIRMLKFFLGNDIFMEGLHVSKGHIFLKTMNCTQNQVTLLNCVAKMKILNTGIDKCTFQLYLTEAKIKKLYVWPLDRINASFCLSFVRISVCLLFSSVSCLYNIYQLSICMHLLLCILRRHQGWPCSCGPWCRQGEALSLTKTTYFVISCIIIPFLLVFCYQLGLHTD